MRFVPYHRLDAVPNIVVDGAAGPGTILTLSHWPKSGTPERLKRDTSTQSVFAYLDTLSPHLAADVASNNHFDEDGLMGIFSLINPAFAQKHRELLEDTASAGDFGVFKNRCAARIAMTIGVFADAAKSPLPAQIVALPQPDLAGELYLRLLDLLPDMLTNTEAYRDHWAEGDAKLAASEALIEKGSITIEERPALDLAIVRLPAFLSASEVHPFAQLRTAVCHPYALNSRTKCTRILLFQGKYAEFYFRYESWVQLVSRRPLPRIDLSVLARELTQEEASGVRWIFDGVDGFEPRLRLEGRNPTSLSPAEIETRLEQHLSSGVPAWDPYD
jgi:hypothetical protein